VTAPLPAATETHAHDRSARRQITDDAYERIRQDILTCALAPGMRFSESQLSESLGMGRTPVREALARLRQVGLVESFPRSGYRVTPITLRDVQEIFEARLLLECESAERLARRGLSQQEHEHLLELARRPYRVDTAEDRSEWLRDNTEFHVEIARMAGNRRLAGFLEQTLGEMERLLTVGWTVSSMLGQHVDLVEAIASGDPDLARRRTEQTVSRSKENTIKALMSSPALQQANIF
jgi:DNA-binding GntR family transcriptional regulator